MSDTVHCATHGETDKAYVCAHLIGDSNGLGFNRNDPTDDNPFPDAWCDDCEIIRVTSDGWDEQSEKLAGIKLICSGCYRRARIRNTRTASNLDDLNDLRWKCHTCDEWHTGPILDFSSDFPDYWRSEYAADANQNRLTKDTCVIANQDFFVRGVLELPIVGTGQCFCWGVWGSVSRDNFQKFEAMYHDSKRVELPPMFSWLSNSISEYPDTLNLKMYAHTQIIGQYPKFELEPTDHPLSQEFHNGITPERVKEIMRNRLRDL
jgi:hypothetical protein